MAASSLSEPAPLDDRADTGEALRPLDALEDRLGVRFADRALLQSALTHRSYLNEAMDPEAEDNERLEFLGDALLGLAVAAHLYGSLPDAPEGELTALRAAVVRASALADCARAIDLGLYLRMGRGEATSGGRDRDGLLCDALEALVGAALVEHGTEVARGVAMRLVGAELARVVAGRSAKDPKTILQEHTQGRWRLTPTYETVAATGPDHAKRFVVRVLVGGESLGVGEGTSKAVAAHGAARQALEALLAREGLGAGPAGAGGSPSDPVQADADPPER